MTRGEDAERQVRDALRAALPADWRIHANCRWLGRNRSGAHERRGEADVVIVAPDGAILVVEVKAGEEIRCGGAGTWWIGPIELDRSPFAQAEDSRNALVAKLGELPAWPAAARPRAGHAVAFPDVNLASLGPGHSLLGLDADRELVLDADAFASPAATRRAVERAFRLWTGDPGPPAPVLAGLVEGVIAPTATLRRLVKADLDDARRELVSASAAQQRVLDWARNVRRAAVVGPAGSGKSMLAAEKARRLGAEGYRVLVVCFNQALAAALQADLADADAPAGSCVDTFHGLCEGWGRESGGLPRTPKDPGRDWFDTELPAALRRAAAARRGDRFHAVIVDEGQDFEEAWLVALDELLDTPGEDVFWVFHDPGQAVARPDVVGRLGPSLGLLEIPIEENHRNPGAIARRAERFYRGPGRTTVLREPGRGPEVIEAAPGVETVEAVRTTVHQLVHDQGVAPHRIAVLAGGSARNSAVWRSRDRIAAAPLWNGAIDGAGRSLGLAASALPDQPGDVALFETIRRFKGLEREVVILCDLPETGERLDELLYVGMTRATGHLVIVAPPALATRLR